MTGCNFAKNLHLSRSSSPSPSQSIGNRRRASLQQRHRQGACQVVARRYVAGPSNKISGHPCLLPTAVSLQPPLPIVFCQRSRSLATSLAPSSPNSRLASPPASSTSLQAKSSLPTLVPTPSAARFCGTPSSRAKWSWGAFGITSSVRLRQRTLRRSPSEV